MPKISLYHPEGAFAALGELLTSIDRRGWGPEIFVEAGSQRSEAVAEVMPSWVRWRMHRLDEMFSVVHIQAPT